MAPTIPLSSIISRTIAELPSRVLPRQATITVTPPATATIIPTTSTTQSNNDLSGGAIAGIVIGSILAFLLILGLIKWALGRNQGGDPTPPPSRHHSRSRSRHSHAHYTTSSPVRRSRSRSHGHYRRSVEVVQPMAEPQRVYVSEPRRGRQNWR